MVLNMKILLVHSGYTNARHMNNYEALIKLFDSVYGADCETLICGKINGPCTSMVHKDRLPHHRLEYSKQWCAECEKRVFKRLESFRSSILRLSGLVSANDIEYRGSYRWYAESHQGS